MRDIAKKVRSFLIRGLDSNTDKLLMISGKIAANSILSVQTPIDRLSGVGFKIYSQFDEDGIIEWLVQRIPVSSNRFVEFGVENYCESNTRFLLKNRNWKGLVLDSSSDYTDFIRSDEVFWRHDLSAHCAFVTPENINQLMKEHNFTGNIGVLSIDAGGMDYWIWKAIDVVNPDIVICEYNAVFGDKYPLVIPYDKDFISRKVHFSGLYWGSSTKAFEKLALEKKYVLIGSNIGGTNLFFVRDALFTHIDHLIKDKRSRPSLYRDSRSPDGKLTYVSGIKRLEMIKHLPVINLDSGEQVLLGSLSPLYSDEWKMILS